MTLPSHPRDPLSLDSQCVQSMGTAVGQRRESDIFTVLQYHPLSEAQTDRGATKTFMTPESALRGYFGKTLN